VRQNKNKKIKNKKIKKKLKKKDNKKDLDVLVLFPSIIS